MPSPVSTEPFYCFLPAPPPPPNWTRVVCFPAENKTEGTRTSWMWGYFAENRGGKCKLTQRVWDFQLSSPDEQPECWQPDRHSEGKIDRTPPGRERYRPREETKILMSGSFLKKWSEFLKVKTMADKSHTGIQSFQSAFWFHILTAKEQSI